MSLRWSDAIDAMDWDELAALYRAAPLGHKTAEGLKTVYGNSMYRCFAYEDGVLVGAGRVLADGVDCAYICDVALLPSHQGRGLGAQLVQRLVDCARGHLSLIHI